MGDITKETGVTSLATQHHFRLKSLRRIREDYILLYHSSSSSSNLLRCLQRMVSFPVPKQDTASPDQPKVHVTTGRKSRNRVAVSSSEIPKLSCFHLKETAVDGPCPTPLPSVCRMKRRLLFPCICCHERPPVATVKTVGELTGAMYIGVPTPFVLSSVLESNLDIPKSPSLHTPSLLTKTFCGLRSRCRIDGCLYDADST